SYETGGLTTPDDLSIKLKSKGMKRRDYRHYLFGREDKPCHICGENILKTRMSGRRIYICSSCQNS
ncbi:MAG: endonuclease VIII, partial [Balneolaceae bacterium]